LEADWSVEIGEEMPVIDASWSGLVDLVEEPHRIHELEEVVRFPPLGRALLQINQEGKSRQRSGDPAVSPLFWTSKCDLWELKKDLDNWDPYEMDAETQDSQAAVACYIDLLPRFASPGSGLLFSTWQDAEHSAKSLALAMRRKKLSCARADFIVRSAASVDRQGFGITVYLTVCGPSRAAAFTTLAAALQILTETLDRPSFVDCWGNQEPLQ
jgi:hypothetical protein